MIDGWVCGPMAGQSPGTFPATFPATFFWTVLPLISDFRALADLSWFHSSSSCFSDYIGRVVGKIDVSGAIERSAYEW